MFLPSSQDAVQGIFHSGGSNIVLGKETIPSEIVWPKEKKKSKISGLQRQYMLIVEKVGKYR